MRTRTAVWYETTVRYERSKGDENNIHYGSIRRGRTELRGSGTENYRRDETVLLGRV